MFRKQASLLPDSSCHWPKGERAREGRKDREREGRREKGGRRRGRMGEKDGERGVYKLEMIFHFPLQDAVTDSHHSNGCREPVCHCSLSLQSNSPSPTPTDVFNVKLIIK